MKPVDVLVKMEGNRCVGVESTDPEAVAVMVLQTAPNDYGMTSDEIEEGMQNREFVKFDSAVQRLQTFESGDIGRLSSDFRSKMSGFVITDPNEVIGTPRIVASKIPPAPPEYKSPPIPQQLRKTA